jgi:hypothetical protein
MLKVAKADAGRGLVAGSAIGRADADIYDHHAGNLYRQVLFTLDDGDLAEQIVSDVIVGECVRPPAALGGREAARRLAVAAYRRCMDAAGGPASASPGFAAGAEDRGGCAGLRGMRDVIERGVLSLVVFGGLEYRQVAADLGIRALDVAALLRTALGDAAAPQPDGDIRGRAWP